MDEEAQRKMIYSGLRSNRPVGHQGKMNAYSQDLREKIMAAVFGRGMSKSDAARTFGVSLSSVKRYTRAASEEENARGRPPGSSWEMTRRWSPRGPASWPRA
jgi:transposase-like protein